MEYSEQDLKYLEQVADSKWEDDDDYRCRKCGHRDYKEGKTPFSRKCLNCSYYESAIVKTAFEGLRMPLSTAIEILVWYQDTYMDFYSYITETKRNEWLYINNRLPLTNIAARMTTGMIEKHFKISKKGARKYINRIMDWIMEHDNPAYWDGAPNSWYRGLTENERDRYTGLYNLLIKNNERTFLSDIIEKLSNPNKF